MTSERHAIASDLKPLGVWFGIDGLPRARAVDFVQSLERWGYSALWTPEAVGRDPFTLIAYLGARTEKLIFATGIANIYARDPMTMRASHKTLSELLPGRFILGLGASHEHLVSKLRGHTYEKPVPAMRRFLEAFEGALYMGPPADQDAPVVLAALRKYMLRLAGQATAGAHPYLVPPEHTRHAREVLGEGPLLCVEQKIIAQTDPDRARALARKVLKMYIRLPNYQNNLRDYGFDDGDFADGGSDRLVDALVAWGDLDAIRARIQAHLDAGADHVCIQPFDPTGGPAPDMELLEALAPRGA
ncbi:MAG: TIGR03620 family F420-dependent LLM class oxidoreductase [Myxococcales bacterium]|nr:TIGR03620 family F420-dependent LLM class oxidoreductase [Myxococcales bacterium]